jgi:O-antigen/teichoic acid export membrane protein
VTVLRRIVRGRAVPALAVSALASFSGFVVAVAVARTSTTADTGRYGIAAAAVFLVTASARSAVTDPLIADAHRHPSHTRRLGRASLVGLLGAVVLLGVGTAVASEYLVIAALAVHGLTIRECVRAVLVATGSARTAVVLEAAWAAASASALAGTFSGVWGGTVAFTIWALSGALLGYVAAARTRSDLVPVWSRTPVPGRRSVAFASDTLVGSGVVQLVTWIATAIGGLAIAAALRGAGTLAGPVTVGLSAARAVLIPRALRHLGSSRGVRGLVRDTALMSGLALPALVFLAFLPDAVGGSLLGATWLLVGPVLPLTATELWFQLVASVPEAAHRALGRGRRIVVVRSGSAVVRLPVVIAAAPHGIGAVVSAAALVTLLSATAWWWSLVTLSRPSPTLRVRPGVTS